MEQGALRWGRLTNLVAEAKGALAFDPQQLWLLADWVLGEDGGAVRKPLTQEIVRMLDAVVAGRVFCFCVSLWGGLDNDAAQFYYLL